MSKLTNYSDVDDGSTVTDFLPAERERGITIQSAAITFQWPPTAENSAKNAVARDSHTVNLIDTPGHADFTFEVARSLRVLDGAVCILDGVAGVEAQTERVWTQAHSYQIPRIIFVNKLDRDGAAFARCVREVATRLKGHPAVCQIPWWEGGRGKFIGVGDVIDMRGLRWMSEDGKSVKAYSLEALRTEAPELAKELVVAREALVGILCTHDEIILESWLDCNDDCTKISPAVIRDSLRRCIADGAAALIPIFAGASFRNIGVQPLLDAINHVIPNPISKSNAEIQIGSQKSSLKELLTGETSVASSRGGHVVKAAPIRTSLVSNIQGCALAFKVVNDLRRGVLVYVRVYSGSIDRNATLWNPNLQVSEKAQKLLLMHASDAVEIQSIQAGQIGVISGSKYARTGDTLIAYKNLNPKSGPPAPLHEVQLKSIDVPPPVFFAAIAPNSLSDEKDVEEKLAMLLREDPSLQVQVVEETGQTLLSGMGELHLEIARDRLVNDFKAKATMGKIEISYRETLQNPTTKHHFLVDREAVGKKGKAGCSAMIEPLSDMLEGNPQTLLQDGNAITLLVNGESDMDALHEAAQLMYMSKTAVRRTLINGALAGMIRGPRCAFPLHGVHVILDFDPSSDYYGADTTPALISTAARSAVQKAAKAAADAKDIAILEPVMNVVISCDEASIGNIMHDLASARGGQVLSLENDSDVDASSAKINLKDVYAPPDPFGGPSQETSGPGLPREITARVPLKEMVGYLKHLRSMTAGRGTFVMTVDQYEKVTGLREKALL